MTEETETKAPRVPPRRYSMAAALREIGEQRLILVLDEREQDMQQVPLDENGLPAAREEDVARIEFVVTEGYARLTVNKIREHGAGSGIFECRCPAQGPDGREFTMLHYVHVDQILRFATKSNVEIEL